RVLGELDHRGNQGLVRVHDRVALEPGRDIGDVTDKEGTASARSQRTTIQRIKRDGSGAVFCIKVYNQRSWCVTYVLIGNSYDPIGITGRSFDATGATQDVGKHE